MKGEGKMADEEKVEAPVKEPAEKTEKEKKEEKGTLPLETKAPAKEEKKEEPGEKTGRRPANCSQCKKRLSRKQWYYRNGNYFCSKGCWKTASEKKAA